MAWVRKVLGAKGIRLCPAPSGLWSGVGVAGDPKRGSATFGRSSFSWWTRDIFTSPSAITASVSR